MYKNIRGTKKFLNFACFLKLWGHLIYILNIIHFFCRMLILNLDTSLNKGSFCISSGQEILLFEVNEKRNEQAGWLHDAIQRSLKKAGLNAGDLNAVAVSNGPGSYTGLRIGLAAAKGLCYALNIPLICISTLEILAKSVQYEAIELICPMIDARRMEVFTALYDKSMQLVQKPFSVILNEERFSDILKDHFVLFTGDGSPKLSSVLKASAKAEMLVKNIDARDMVALSGKYFNEKIFQDVAYCEPYYVKDVYISVKK